MSFAVVLVGFQGREQTAFFVLELEVSVFQALGLASGGRGVIYLNVPMIRVFTPCLLQIFFAVNRVG